MGLFNTLIVFITTSLVEYSVSAQCSRTTPPCGLICHCQSGSQCTMRGCGTAGCQIGWDGPTCQRENVVLGLGNSGFQVTLGYSSALSGYYAALAFDGAQTRYFSTYSNEDPYLWVNLGSVQTVYALSVNTTAYDFQIFINSKASRDGATLCKSYNATQTTATKRYDVTCYQPLDGQYVWITRPGVTTLNVTEMEIYKCSDYWFGVQCDKACNCQTKNEVCNKTTGGCISGCVAGYAQPGCQDCIDGHYGSDCKVCGKCKDGAKCNKSSGICHGGCKDGYTPPYCQGCKDGRYGSNCSVSCGNCIDDQVCDKTTGACPGNCTTRFTGSKCNDCIDGRYGTTCSNVCGNCKDEQVCEKDYGECPGGCKDGYEPPLCKECDDGHYGPDCSLICGDCLDGSQCNKTDGSCLNGCNPGSCPPLCKITANCRIKSTEAPSLPAGYIGAVVVIAVLCAILFITTLVFYMKAKRITRLYQEQVKAKYTHFQVKERGDETPTPEPVYEEMSK